MQIENTENLVEVYKTILQQEISNHTIFITVLLGIVVILLGTTWWWNKSGANKELKTEVEKRFEKEKNKFHEEVQNEINKKIDQKVKDFKVQIDILEADVARAMGLSARKEGLYSYSIFWFAKFLKSTMELKNPKGIRIGTNFILEDLRLLEKKDEDENKKTIYKCHFVLETVSKLPEILNNEKKEILKICKGREEKED